MPALGTCLQCSFTCSTFSDRPGDRSRSLSSIEVRGSKNSCHHFGYAAIMCHHRTNQPPVWLECIPEAKSEIFNAIVKRRAFPFVAALKTSPSSKSNVDHARSAIRVSHRAPLIPQTSEC